MRSGTSLLGRLGILLKSPRLAALLLTLFTLACLVGNFVPQESNAGIEAVATWKSAHPYISAAVAALDGFHIYTSRWFVTIVALLAANTLACTLGQLSRARRTLVRIQTPLPGPPAGVVGGAPEQVLAEVRATAIFSGLRVRTRTDGDGSLLVHGLSSAGLWGSILLHLALVMVFITVVAGSMTSWSASVVLTEGQSFNPARQSLHGVQTAWLARPQAAYRLPIIHLVRHYPRFQAPGYNPDAASRLTLELSGVNKTVVLRYGKPINVSGLTLRQTRRYGAAALVTYWPSAASQRRSSIEPPPPIGLIQPDPDGGLSVSLPFTNSQDGAVQKREIVLPVYESPIVFHLAPGPAATDYARSLAERFVLVLEGPVRATLRVGDHVNVPGGQLRFESLGYWTVLSAGSAPLTPWFFAAGWLVVIGGALVVMFPLRRIELDLRPGPQPGTCEVRFRVPATRGSGLFAERANSEIATLLRGEGPLYIR